MKRNKQDQNRKPGAILWHLNAIHINQQKKRGGGSGKSKGQVNEVGGFICGYLIVHQANYHHIKPIYKTCRLYAGQEIKQNIKQIEL